MDFIKGEITAYCFMVQRGKPAAMMPIQERFREGVINFVTNQELQVYTEPLAEGWVALWIYKYPHILDVIKNIPQTPSSVFDHWILGKLFGYEESAIQEFVTKV
ncbi:hypothetical protein [Brevibacillus parabrevis]|jgi:hypothetical protein|uniref:hypothetical protein n=1 Tax=Brevibacillus parabrevis TaxID=54914 RepID=UPI0024921075|nr:hypothetical protein [Brevibacillus parabrevis]